MHGLSIRKAAQTFPRVEPEALRCRIHSLVDMHAKSGRWAVYLTRGHEQGILEVVAARAHMEFCVEAPELRNIYSVCSWTSLRWGCGADIPVGLRRACVNGCNLSYSMYGRAVM
jgi:hypothetical protein